jgi:hemolysin III
MARMETLIGGTEQVRPSWRGRLHTWAFAVSPVLAAAFVWRADGGGAKAAVAVYAATMTLVFGTSAAYHRLARSPRARAVMQRLDHSMIYALIAGTYVPICLLALPLSWGIPVLCVVAAGAVTGMVLKLTAFHRRGARVVAATLYPVLGWIAVVASPVMVTHLTPAELGLIVAGGLSYTAGAIVFGRKRPDPWPRTFGYHEIWHAFTVLAAGCFAGVVWLVSA